MSGIHFTRGYAVPTGPNADYAGYDDCGCGCKGAPGGCGGAMNGFGDASAEAPGLPVQMGPLAGLAIEGLIAFFLFKANLPMWLKGTLLIRSGIKIRDSAAQLGYLKALPQDVQDTLYQIPTE